MKKRIGRFSSARPWMVDGGPWPVARGPWPVVRMGPNARLPMVLMLVLCLASPLPAQEMPPPAAERPLTGSITLGNRWQQFAGSRELYRSTVNLGEGPRLLGLNLDFGAKEGAAGRRLFDRAALRASSWGNEPASSATADLARDGLYRLRLTYRRMDYFNAIPSFANPLPGRTGETQHALDISRTLAGIEITVRPDARISPFFAFDRDSGRGPGRTTFVQDGNEYTVSTLLDNANDSFLGGVRLFFDRWSATIEGGGGRFRDSESLSFSGSSFGNRSTVFLGQRLRLDTVDQAYRIKGRDRFARAVVEAAPWSRLSVHAQFAFSQPSTDVQYTANDTGNLVLLNTLQFFTGGQTVGRSDGLWPHPSGSIGLEFRPYDRLRLIETVSAERFSLSGAVEETRTVSGGEISGSARLTGRSGGRLEASFVRHRLEAAAELTDVLTLRAAHGYSRAHATSPGSALAATATSRVTRQTGNLGATIRWSSRLNVSTDLESSAGDSVFFRTDQRIYRRVRVHGRYRLFESLTAAASVLIWNNENNSLGIDFTQRSREASAELAFVPGGGRTLSLTAGYTRGTLRSDLPFLVPQSRQPDRSVYRDRGHTGNLMVVWKPHARVQWSAGGNAFVSTGRDDADSDTRPTRFYQTRSAFLLDVSNPVAVEFEWQYHAYANLLFAREHFRTHLIATGVRWKF